MNCKKCGNELQEGMTFCNKCGTRVGENSNTNERNEGKQNNTNNNKIKFKVADVVNRESVINSSNRVAYIANGWALELRSRGENFAIIVGIIYFIIGLVAAGNVPSGESGFLAFISTFGVGILYCIIIIMTFNTIAFIVRMGAEVIQLLDDIKNKK